MIIKNKNSLFLIGILIFSSLLMFPNLGSRFLWGDESQNALFSLNTLKFGIPTFYDGEDIVVDNHIRLEENFWLSEKFLDWQPDQKLNKFEHALKWQAWLPFYFTALSFSLFGLSEFAARLPFAVFGLVSLILLYFFVIELKNDKKLARLSVILLALFIPFYLYSRQSRYYALSMLLNLLVLFFYTKIIKNNTKKNWIFFIIVNILSFYTFYISFLSTYAAIGIDSLIRKNKKLIMSLIKASVIIAIFTLPWIFWAQLLTKTGNFSILRIIFGFFYQLSYVFFYIFPLIFFIYLPFLIIRKNKNRFSLDPAYRLILLIIFFGIFLNTLGPWDLPAFRYTVYLFPLFMIINAAIVLNLYRWKKWIGILVILLLILSNLLLISPLKLAESVLVKRSQSNESNYFIVDNLKIRFPLLEYIHEINAPYTSANQAVIEYLREKENSGDTILTNAEYLPLVWYSNSSPIIAQQNITPTWIIPRKPYSLWGDKIVMDDYSYVLSKIDARYEKISINSTDYIYPLDSPHPRTHRYTTNKARTTSDRYPYETYPIEIYRLKE